MNGYKKMDHIAGQNKKNIIQTKTDYKMFF